MSPDHPAWAAGVAALAPVLGADVVDLGCGEGHLARWCVTAGATSVLALDLDTERLDRARAHPGGQGLIHYEQADLEQATLPFEAYDLATCGVLHHLAEPLRFARMTRAGLRPGARLVLRLPRGAADPLPVLRRGGLVAEAGATAPGGSVLVLVLRKPLRGR